MGEDPTAGMPVGRRSTSPGRTIGEGEFGLLTSLTWTNDELHSNKEYMRASEFGERLLGGSVLLALVSGLYCQNPLFRDLFAEVIRGPGRAEPRHLLGGERPRVAALEIFAGRRRSLLADAARPHPQVVRERQLGRRPAGLGALPCHLAHRCAVPGG